MALAPRRARFCFGRRRSRDTFGDPVLDAVRSPANSPQRSTAAYRLCSRIVNCIKLDGADRTLQMVSKKRRYDLREFWPWYERSVSLPPGAGHATPPPFALGDIGNTERPARRKTRTSVSFVGLSVVIVLLGLLLWILIR
jgi:hypothetical protein